MRKKNICILIFIVLILPLFSQEEQIYFEFQGNGYWVLKQETWYEYNSVGKKVHIKTSDGSDLFYEYDLNNNMTYSKDGIGEYNYSYDAENNLICKKSNTFEIWYEYDNHKNIISVKTVNSSGQETINSIATFEYDEHGNIITHKILNMGLEWNYEYKYDSRGNTILFRSESDDKFYSYDKNNNLTYSRNRDNEKWFEYEYDSKGNITHKITKYYITEKNKEIFIQLDEWYEFDKNNNLIHYKDSTTNEKWYLYDYDSEGRITHETCFFRDLHFANQ